MPPGTVDTVPVAFGLSQDNSGGQHIAGVPAQVVDVDTVGDMMAILGYDEVERLTVRGRGWSYGCFPDSRCATARCVPGRRTDSVRAAPLAGYARRAVPRCVRPRLVGELGRGPGRGRAVAGAMG